MSDADDDRTLTILDGATQSGQTPDIVPDDGEWSTSALEQLVNELPYYGRAFALLALAVALLEVTP